MFEIIKKAARKVRVIHKSRRTQTELNRLTNSQLRDIGIERGDIRKFSKGNYPK